MYNILICDDEADIRSALKIYLARDGYKIFEALDIYKSVTLNDITQRLATMLDEQYSALSVVKNKEN